MTERLAALTRTLSSWMHEQPHSLAELEQHVVRLLKELGASLLTGLATLAAPANPARSIPCACGQQAAYQRQRKAQVTTLLGPICIWRSYYLCAACGQGQHPLDAQLQFCAGSRSAALDELLALLGATQDSFVQAAQVLERLSLVHVSANSVREATEHLGGLLLEKQVQPQSERPSSPPAHALTTARVSRLYITMDGVLAHLHERGWSELKVGCCYHTRSRVNRKRPERQELRAQSASYVSALEEAQTFGWRLWQEAVRRGYLSSDEVVVLGDGAHWIWNTAGAEAVAMVRAWLLSERWEEALALRGVRRRSYRRKQADQQRESSEEKRQADLEQASEVVKPIAKARQELSAEVLAQVQAELIEQRGKNGWGQAWSVQRQRQLAAQREERTPVIAA